MIGIRALLKHCFILEGPLRFRNSPLRMVAHRAPRVIKIGLMIRAEKQLCVGTHPRSQEGEEFWLNDAVFVMALLRPWIGKQNEDRRNHRFQGKRFQEQPRLCVQKMELLKAGAIALTVRPLDPLADDVDSNAHLIGMHRGIGREKMPVPGPDFAGERIQWTKDAAHLPGQGRPARRNDRTVIVCGIAGWHVMNRPDSGRPQSPTRLDSHH